MTAPLWLRRLSGRPVEAWSGSASLAWAAYLTLGQHDLDANPNYTVAVQILPEEAWVSGAALMGVAQIALACMAWRGARIAVLLLAAFGWLLLGVSFAASRHGAPAFVLYGTWGAVNIHAAIRTWCRRPGRAL